MFKGFESGADDYVTNPFPISVFRKKVAVFLERINRQPSGNLYDDGSMIENPTVQVGDIVQKNHIITDGLSSETDRSLDFIIMVKVRTNENTAATRNTGTARFYLPNENFLPLCDNPHPVSFPFNVKENAVSEMEEYLEDYVEGIEPNMDFTSKETYAASFHNPTSLIFTIGGTLSIIIGFIGIANFVNSILTSIITGRKEFAML